MTLVQNDIEEISHNVTKSNGSNCILENVNFYKTLKVIIIHSINILQSVQSVVILEQ